MSVGEEGEAEDVDDSESKAGAWNATLPIL